MKWSRLYYGMLAGFYGTLAVVEVVDQVHDYIVKGGWRQWFDTARFVVFG